MGKTSTKKRSELSCDSKSSLQKVVAVLPRPCKEMMVWVCGAVGWMMWGFVGEDMVKAGLWWVEGSIEMSG